MAAKAPASPPPVLTRRGLPRCAGWCRRCSTTMGSPRRSLSLAVSQPNSIEFGVLVNHLEAHLDPDRGEVQDRVALDDFAVQWSQADGCPNRPAQVIGLMGRLSRRCAERRRVAGWRLRPARRRSPSTSRTPRAVRPGAAKNRDCAAARGARCRVRRSRRSIFHREPRPTRLPATAAGGDNWLRRSRHSRRRAATQPRSRDRSVSPRSRARRAASAPTRRGRPRAP
jgi:hypothetical protein